MYSAHEILEVQPRHTQTGVPSHEIIKVHRTLRPMQGPLRQRGRGHILRSAAPMIILTKAIG